MAKSFSLSETAGWCRMQSKVLLKMTVAPRCA